MRHRDMTDRPAQHRWRRVETLFHEAVDRPAADRASYLRDQCRNDPGLFNEVLSLLESFKSSEEFLEGLGERETELLADALGAWEVDSAAKQTRVPSSIQFTESHGATCGPAKATSPTPSGRDLTEFTMQLKRLRPELEVLGEIRRGGIGVILRVRDRRLQRDLAVKILDHESQYARVTGASNELSPLEREGRAAAGISSDYIVRVYEIGALRNHQMFLIFEWIAGPSLQDLLSDNNHLPPRDAADLIRQAALGLGAAHRAGLIHGDIKPANILLDPLDQDPCGESSPPSPAGTLPSRYRAKITDFGLARAVHESQYQGADTPRFAGTVAYASPERLIDLQPGNSLSDVWSLGVTLYRTLTGISPYRGAPHSIVRQMRDRAPSPPRILEPQIPQDLESICLKAMALEPKDRYADGDELAADLQRFLDGVPIMARPITAWHRSWRWMVRNPRLAATGALLGLALMTLVVGAAVSSVIFARQNQQLIEQKRDADLERLQRVIVASPSLLPSLLDSQDLNRNVAKPFLQGFLDNASHDGQSGINAAVILAELGDTRTELLIEATLNASLQPQQCQNLIRALRQDREVALASLKSAFQETNHPHHQARIAIVAAHLGASDWLEQISAQHHQPGTRTTLIHLMPRFHGQLDEIGRLLDGDATDDVKYVLSMALNLFDAAEYSGQAKHHMAAALERLLTTTRDSGVRAAASLAIRHWGVRSPAPTKPGFSNPTTGWRELAPGIRLVRIPAGTLTLGRTSADTLHEAHAPHEVTLTCDFWLADREVSVELYQQFLNDPNYPESLKPLRDRRQEHEIRTSPTPAHPIQRVSWNDAAMFCNWLSWQHGKQPRYVFTRVDNSTHESTNKERSSEQVEMRYSNEWWVSIVEDANGFRLPTLAQWEMGCRAGSQTDFFFGNDFNLFNHYGRFSSARILETALCGSLLPNRYGLHETHGNVWEWCEDWYEPIGPEPLIDPEGPTQPLPDFIGRNFAGGGVQTLSGEPIAGARGYTHVDNRFGNLGFRIVLP